MMIKKYISLCAALAIFTVPLFSQAADSDSQI